MVTSRRDAVSDEHKRAIGAVVVAWSGLEESIRQTLMTMIRRRHEHGIAEVIVHTLFQNRLILQVMSAIAPFALASDDVDALKPIMSEMLTLSAERDRIVHGVWWKAEGREPTRQKPKRGAAETEDFPPASAESIHEIARKIRAVNGALVRWSVDAGVARLPSGRKP